LYGPEKKNRGEKGKEHQPGRSSNGLKHPCRANNIDQSNHKHAKFGGVHKKEIKKRKKSKEVWWPDLSQMC